MQASLQPRTAFMRLNPSKGVAAGARLALIAGGARVVKIEAPRPLQKIAAGRGHVAELRRGTGEDSARQKRIALPDPLIIGEVAVWNECSDP